MMKLPTKGAHGGPRTGAGRKRTAVKVRSVNAMRITPATKVAFEAGRAVSEDVLDEGRRVARHALHAQKKAMTTKMKELGLAPLDILQTCMLMLYERVLDARAAGGVLVLGGAGPQPVFETETALLVAAAEIANKAAQYVHPKLVVVQAQATGQTYEERLKSLR